MFNITEFYVLPTECICVFRTNVRKTVIIPYTALNGFITEMVCVYCAVRTQFL
jgi:hypothetical protein